MPFQYTSSGKLKFHKLRTDEQMGLLRAMFDALVEAKEDDIDLSDMSNCVFGTSIHKPHVQRALNAAISDGVIVRDKSDPNARIHGYPLDEEWVSLKDVFQESGLSEFLFRATTAEEEKAMYDGRARMANPSRIEYLEYTGQQLAILRVLTVADMVQRGIPLNPRTSLKKLHKMWDKRFDKLVHRAKIVPDLVGEDYCEVG